MAGLRAPMPAAAKGIAPQQPGYDPLAEAQRIIEGLKSTGLSATQDVPGVADANGNIVPGASLYALREHAAVDPAVMEEAQKTLAQMSMLQGAAGYKPASAYSVKQGHMAGPVAPGPIWEGAKSLAMMPLAREQMDVTQKNQANDLINQAVAMTSGANAQDRNTATTLAAQTGAASVAAAQRAEQSKQFATQQQTELEKSRIAAKATTDAARLRSGQQFRQVGAIADAADDALKNYLNLIGFNPDGTPNGKGNKASVAYQDFGDRRIGTAAGKTTADILGAASNHVGQVLEKRGLRGKQMDEILKSLQSGINDPAVGLKMAQHYREHIQSLRSEALAGGMPDDTGGAAPAFDPDAFLKGGE